MRTDFPDPGKYHHVDIAHHCIHWYLKRRRWQKACHYPLTRGKDYCYGHLHKFIAGEVHEGIKKIIKNSTGSHTGQVKNKESYNSLVKNHLSASVGRHHPMIRRQMRLLNGHEGMHVYIPVCMQVRQLKVIITLSYRINPCSSMRFGCFWLSTWHDWTVLTCLAKGTCVTWSADANMVVE